MSKKFLIIAMFLAVFGIIGLATNKAEAGMCYEDPIYNVAGTGKIISGVNFRNNPCMQGSKILRTLRGGTVVTLVGQTDGWYKVKVGDKTGWVGQRYIKVIKKEVKNVVKTTEAKKVASSSGAVKSITVSAADHDVKWSVDGNSDKGFKVVWSKNKGATYPTREGDKYQYFSEPDKRSTQLDAFDGEGTYYVRVCEYLGGACGVYSNEVSTYLYNN